MPKLYLQFTLFFLLVLFSFLQYRLWFDENSLRDMSQLKNHLKRQMAENNRLKIENEALLTQIRQLKNSNEEEETRARNELGMIKKGETFYQIVR